MSEPGQSSDLGQGYSVHPVDEDEYSCQPGAAGPHSLVGQPPPAAEVLGQPPSAAGDPVRRRKPEYRRRLPHIQDEGRTLVVTFCTWRRWELPESVRGHVL